ncbi:MAG: hypothetical protein R3B91_06155 [Planctomycetaceae bacterium]
MWAWGIVAVTVLASLLSMYGSLHTWRDIQSGRPSYASLVDYTGISRPEELVSRFGEFDDEGRFTLSENDRTQLPRARWVVFMDQPIVDVVMILISVIGGFSISNQLRLACCSCWAFIWMLLSYTVAAWVVMQHPQLRG